ASRFFAPTVRKRKSPTVRLPSPAFHPLQLIFSIRIGTKRSVRSASFWEDLACQAKQGIPRTRSPRRQFRQRNSRRSKVEFRSPQAQCPRPLSRQGQAAAREA